MKVICACGREFPTWDQAVAHVEEAHLNYGCVFNPSQASACDVYYSQTHYQGEPCPGCGVNFLTSS